MKCQCGCEAEVLEGRLFVRGHNRRVSNPSCFSKGNVLGFRHGRTHTVEYGLLKSAKYHARVAELPFNLDFSDIVIPEFCPVRGVKLIRSKGHLTGDSPTIDRFYPEKGYVKGNVWVISYRANSFKSDFTVKQLKAFVAAIEAHMPEE